MRDRRAVTILELVVVLAIVGILAGLIGALARPAAELRAANAVKNVLLFARAQALWQGVAVAVTQLPLGGGLLVSALPEGEPPTCGSPGGSALNRLLLSDYAGVRFTAGLPGGGLLWLPSGSGRRCDGGGVISSTLRLSSLTGAAEVVVSSLGRVRVQRAP